MEIKQHLKMSQALVMTPQLQQAIRLLQLSRLELIDEIRKELDANPVLADDDIDPRGRIRVSDVPRGEERLQTLDDRARPNFRTRGDRIDRFAENPLGKKIQFQRFVPEFDLKLHGLSIPPPLSGL